MSKDILKTIAIGRIGKDPEYSHTQGGTLVAKFSLACGQDYKDKSGSKVEKTAWLPMKAFGKTAEILQAYCGKGSKLYTESTYSPFEYEKDGQKRYGHDFLLDSFQMLDGKPQGESRQPPARPQSESVAGMGGGDPFGEEDIPFNSFHKGSEFVI